MRRALRAALFVLFIAGPVAAQIPVSTAEGDSGLTILTFTIEQGPQNLPGTYEYSTADGTATVADNDYVPAAGVVTIPAGGGTATIEIAVVGDRRVESDEVFTLSISNLQNGPYEITIRNDDVATLTVANASVIEGNTGTTSLGFTVSLTNPAAVPVTATYATTTGGTASPGQDFLPAEGTITFAPGETRRTVSVVVIGDTVIEPDETVGLRVTLPGSNAPSTATGTILNDDTARVTVANAFVTEGNAGTTTLAFVVTLVSSSAIPINATYETSGGSATPGQDYVPAQGTITFAPGETTRTINVVVTGDTLVEADETVNLRVTPVPGGAVFTATGTIVNDDQVALSVANVSVQEGNSGTTPMTFDVTIAAPAAVPVVVTAVTEAGTATSGEDFQPLQTTVTFGPGETRATVTVNVIGDTRFEADETLALVLTLAGASPVRATGTIVNDDAAPPSTLTIVSGNNQQGILGQRVAQPLVVEVRDARGAPFAGANVQWRVTRGSAQLSSSTSTTDAQGRASNTILALNTVGTIEVEASVTGLTPVRFTVTSATNLEARAEGPVAVPVGRVLDQICARNEEQFNAVCRALAGLSEVTPTLERIAPQPSGAQARIATEFVSAVTSDIRNRLSMLRSGVGRLSVQRLSLFHDGRAIPVAQLATAFLPQATDAGAPEDDYSNWSAFLSGNLGDGERREQNGALGFDLETRGLTAGVDRLIGRSGIVGASANWMSLDSDLTGGAGSVDTTGYSLSVYASRGGIGAGTAPNSSYDGMHLDGAITWGRNTYDTEHVVDIPGLPQSRATSENDANIFAVTAAAGFEAHRGRGDFDFSLAGTWSRSDIDELTEEGGGPLILFVQGHEIESLTATAGVSARAAIPVPFGTLLPSFRAELVHEFESDARLVTARFLRDTLGTSFTVPVDQPDENYGKLAAGLQAEFGYGLAAFIEVTQDVSRSDLNFRTLQFSLRKQFR